MKFKIMAALVVLGWSVGVMQVTRAEQAAPATPAAPAAPATAAAQTTTASGGSTWGGVYSEAQAKLGEAAYTKHCAECHGQDLAGDGFAPALRGPEFMGNWNGLTLGDLFERIHVSMPPSNPSSVSAKEKVDIVAFLLKHAAFPVGKTDLPATQDGLKTIKFEATKPGK